MVKPAKIPKFAAASCAYILTKGVRKGKQCRFRVSDEIDFLTFSINHQAMSPARKTIKAHVFSATDPPAFQRRLKMAPTILLTIAGNALAAFPVSLLRASTSLSNHFLRSLYLLMEDPLPLCCLLQKHL